MSGIGHINAPDNIHPPVGQRPVRPGLSRQAPRIQGDDVAFSPLARTVSRFVTQLETLPTIRADKVDEVRDAISRGDYESDDKIDRTIEALLDELNDVG